jgi:hypothetical protein
MAMNYSAWFGKLTAITGNPAAVRILLTTIGAPENGSSIALVLTLIASSLEHIGKQFGLEVAGKRPKNGVWPTRFKVRTVHL